MDFLLAGLNEAQKSAVSSPASVLQVLAPPGSGKTKTLTARVAYLISHDGLKPANIIVCTFTVKAAREMKARIRSLVGDGIGSELILGTFHSVAIRFLRIYGYHIGIDKNFSVADSSDSLAIIKRIIKANRYSTEPKVARGRISGQKARGVSSSEYVASSKNVEDQEFANIYIAYEEALRVSNLLDYDDLLLNCVELLRKHPECVCNVQAVLIDEFQDTNHIQFELMTLFAQRRKKITIVGDPDQSIYGFRHAEIKNLHRMKTIYPDTLVVMLEENYRSSGTILMSAMEVITQDESRPPKKLLATHCPGERPVLRRLPSAAAEAKWLVSEIIRAQALTGTLLGHNDFAILLRAASLSRLIESELGRAGIPYRVVGGVKFFDRVEVKILLDYMRVISQPQHNDALVRIINVPSRKIGEVTVKKLLDEAERQKVPLWNLVLDVAQGNKRPETKLSSHAEKGLETFVNLILTGKKKLQQAGDDVNCLLDLLGFIMKKLSYEDYLRNTYKEDFENRWANVTELVVQATEITSALASGIDLTEESLPTVEGVEQSSSSSAEDVLRRFLANVALATEVEKIEGAEPAQEVTISTIHAAKGLEWPVVFIPGAYDGSIPHSRAEDTDEERRLLYVGMTRAQSLLYISCPMRDSSREQTNLSSFLRFRRMGDCFDVRGPSFHFTVTQDLARILRRPCPPNSVIEAAKNLVERLEDDFWPQDGSDPVTANEHWADARSAGSVFPFESGSKKRRLNQKSEVNALVTPQVAHQQASYSVSSTTMTNGFVSAGAHMKVMEQQATIDPPMPSEVLAQSMSTRPPKAPATLKKRSSGQGSITAFFGNPRHVPAYPAGENVEVAPIFQKASKPQSRNRPNPPAPNAYPLKAIANLASATNAVPSYPTYATSSHRPRTAPIQGRPRPRREATPEAKEDQSARYVLLSSSPVKPDEPVAGSKQAGSRTETVPLPASDFKPVQTFHNTTMSTIAPQKRRLGMGGGMQGWSVKGRTAALPRPKR